MRALVAVTTLAGCIPMATPPVHVRFGGGSTTPAHELQHDDGTTEARTETAQLQLGLDTATLAELPFNVELGSVSTFDNDAGVYLEGGPLHRVTPHLRIGATAGAEYWREDHRGAGATIGATLEYAGDYRCESSSEDEEPGTSESHSTYTQYEAQCGAFAIGAFFAAGHRWLDDEPNYSYAIVGVTFRLAAYAGLLSLH
jgi:hypothetical protein